MVCEKVFWDLIAYQDVIDKSGPILHVILQETTFVQVSLFFVATTTVLPELNTPPSVPGGK